MPLLKGALTKRSKFCHCGTRLPRRRMKTCWACRLEALKTIQPIEQRFWRHVERTSTCWIWTSCLRGGYGNFKTPTTYSAHRASYELFKGAIPKGRLVCHSCDNRKCVNPDHLWLGSHEDNTRDAIQKKRFTNQRFTIEEASAIRMAYRSGKYSLDDLARENKVSCFAIWRIVRGKSYCVPLSAA